MCFVDASTRRIVYIFTHIYVLELNKKCQGWYWTIEEILQQLIDNDDVSMSLSFGDGDDIIKMANRDGSVYYIGTHCM